MSDAVVPCVGVRGHCTTGLNRWPVRQLGSLTVSWHGRADGGAAACAARGQHAESFAGNERPCGHAEAGRGISGSSLIVRLSKFTLHCLTCMRPGDGTAAHAAKGQHTLRGAVGVRPRAHAGAARGVLRRRGALPQRGPGCRGRSHGSSILQARLCRRRGLSHSTGLHACAGSPKCSSSLTACPHVSLCQPVCTKCRALYFQAHL